jgi:N6-L-threonylcarbamoyladenine synthase
MIILGIETSCDETAAAILKLSRNNSEILSNFVFSQIKIHRHFGGVVPKIAGREHLKKIIPLLNKAFQKSKIKPKDIDLIAVTRGPGLAPSLFVGMSAAKALSYVWEKPIVGVNHIEAHLLANWLMPISKKSQILNYKPQINFKFQISNPKHFFPAVGLIVSGGHTRLILIRDFLKYKVLGETLDDAAGECFDKTARILGLSYPGGPAIAEQARQWKFKTTNSKSQIHPVKCLQSKFNRVNSKYKIKNSKQIQILSIYKQAPKFQINLPRPMIDSKNFDFSFSGLKTAVLYDFKKRSNKERKLKKYKQEMCWEIQQAIIDVLTFKTIKAAEKYQAKTILLGGGVTANRELRKQFRAKIKKEKLSCDLRIPNFKFCGDNAAMIALLGFYYFKAGKIDNWENLKIKPNLKLVSKYFKN